MENKSATTLCNRLIFFTLPEAGKNGAEFVMEYGNRVGIIIADKIAYVRRDDLIRILKTMDDIERQFS